jgi:hypothetical protein
MGGQTITVDVCDACWGSGERDRPWANLRTMRNDIERMVAERAVDALARAAGATLQTTRKEVAEIAEILRTASRKRGKSIWFGPLAKSLADLLDRAVQP